MPLTIGEIGASGILAVALAGFGGWIKSISNYCGRLDTKVDDEIEKLEDTLSKKSCQRKIDDRLRVLEGTVAEKSNQLIVHENNLEAGEKQMKEMKDRLAAIDTNIAGVYLLLKEIPLNIEALGEKIATETKEVFLMLDPRIARTEEKIEKLEVDGNQK